jgi:hypothetical protein
VGSEIWAQYCSWVGLGVLFSRFGFSNLGGKGFHLQIILSWPISFTNKL